MAKKKQKDEVGVWEQTIQREADEKHISFEKAAMQNIKYHKSLVDQGIPGSEQSYRFYENLLLRIMNRRAGGGEKKG